VARKNVIQALKVWDGERWDWIEVKMLSLMLCNIKVLTMICDDLCSFLILIWETHTTFTTTCFSLLDVAHWWQEVDFGNKTVAAGELSRVLTRTRGAAMVRKGVLEITQF
jgi:hypothetical protein